MITLITGAPGAGKTAALVLLLQETLATSGRAIYVHGIPDLKIPHQDLTSPDTWHTDVPDGSVIIIDEVQTVWRPRGPGQRVPDHISKLETHRHRGLDFYIITQGPNLVDTNVRVLVGRHIHLRDIGFLGRWWYEWPECADQCRTSWKGAPIKKKYTLPKKIFDQYKSSSLHVKPIRSFPKMLFVAIFALIAAATLAYRFYSSMASKLSPPPAAQVTSGGALPFASTNQGQAAAKPVLTAQQYIDSFVPRIEGLPHTAPRYDEVEKITQAPKVAACVSGIRPGETSPSCICWSQQATRLVIPADMCNQIVASGYFDETQPLTRPQVIRSDTATVSAISSPSQQAAPALSGSGYGLRDSGYINQRNSQVKPTPVGTLTTPG